MPETGKTSTFVFHHDKCDPKTWGPHDVLAFAYFLRAGGDLRHAAHLARLGVELVASDHLTPAGGTLQEVGWSLVDSRDPSTIEPCDDLSELIDGEVTEMCRVYRGPSEWAVPIPMGDGEGYLEGYEYKFCATEAEAIAYAKSMREDAEPGTEGWPCR